MPFKNLNLNRIGKLGLCGLAVLVIFKYSFTWLKKGVEDPIQAKLFAIIVFIIVIIGLTFFHWQKILKKD